MLRFVREQMGLPVDEGSMDVLNEQSAALMTQGRGNYDFFEERDRWQFLSKELS